MKKDFLKNPVTRFLLLFILLYGGWYILYELVLHPWGKLDKLVINNSIFLTKELLQILGYAVISYDYQAPETGSEVIRTVGIDGSSGVWIGDPCNGLILFALFTSLIISFPGPAKHKLWFIPLGLIIIHFANIIRIASLSLIVFYKREYLEFNHDYTFKILVYTVIFLIWVYWVNRWSGLKKKRNVES